MERMTQFRARVVLLLFCVIVGFFGFKLYDLQIIQTGGSTNNSTTFTTLTRVKAARGDILDCNGNVLVSNRASYDLMINHFVLLSATGTSDYLYRLVQRCEEAGIEYTEHFPISEGRPFTYTLDKYDAFWQSAFQSYLANIVKMDSDITAPLLIQRLRSIYRLPEEWSDETARKVLGLYYELNLRNCVLSLSNYIFVEDATDEELSAIVELNVPGLTVEKSTVREYHTVYAAHVLGYIGKMNAEEWEYYKNIDGYTMDAEIGKEGLEKAYEEYLHGVDGWREDVVAKDGSLISSRFIQEPQAGANVELSIDINLQMAAEDRLTSVIESLHASTGDGSDAEGAAVVAIDVRTGQILVCASYPTYDPSRFFEDYSELLNNPLGPMFNRALMGTYPPGSTYKMSMLVAGINSGTISSGTVIEDRGVFNKYNDLKLFCLQYTNYGTVHPSPTAATALKWSCNYFFYELGDRISISAMDETAKGLGLGEPTGVELPEATGIRANPENKKAQHPNDPDNAGWYKGDQIPAAIGQSLNRFTPIQLCVYASTLANRGIRYKATFLNRVVSSDYRSLLEESKKEVISQMDISDDAYYAYTLGMFMVANESGGTAYSTFRNYPITIAAKTGTAQNGQYRASDNGAFVCYAPYENPQIAIAVYGEKAGHGSTLATVAKSILDIYFEVGEIGDVNTFENKLS